MADKMMRISGRGEDGTAKAIKTNNNGNIITALSSTNRIALHQNTNQNSNGETLDVSDFGVVAIQITGTYDADVRFLGAIGGTSYTFIPAKKLGGNVPSSTASGGGIYFIDCRGLNSIQVRVTNYVSGNVSVYAKADSYAPRDLELKGDFGSINIGRSGSISSGRETVSSFSAVVDVTIESLEFSGNHASSLYLILRARDKNGEYSSITNQSSIITDDGAEIRDLNFSNLQSHKSPLWKIEKYDNNNNLYKISLKRPIRFPTGFVLEIDNKENTNLNAALFAILTEHN